MKKRLILSFVVLSLSITGYSQSFMHSVGASISVMNTRINTSYEKYSLTNAFSNITYFPRLTLMETGGTSLSIGAPIGAGVSLSTTTTAETSGIYWGFDLPAVLDFNMGWKSSPDNEDNFGGYIGGGFGYTFTNWSDGNYTDKMNSYGPIVRGGVRIGGFGSGLETVGLTIGLSYKVGFEAQKFKTYGLTLLLDF